jgi:hypothetical protein
MANGPGYPNELKSYDAADGYSSPTMVVMEARLADAVYPTYQLLANGSTRTGSGSAAPVANFDILAADLTLATATEAASGLSIVCAASTRYLVEFMLDFVSPEADDVKFTISGPAAGATGRGTVYALAAAATVADGDVLGPTLLGWTEGTSKTVGSEDTSSIVWGRGWILLDTTAGAISITVAKAADAGADGALKAGSWLRVEPVAA